MNNRVANEAHDDGGVHAVLHFVQPESDTEINAARCYGKNTQAVPVLPGPRVHVFLGSFPDSAQEGAKRFGPSSERV